MFPTISPEVGCRLNCQAACSPVRLTAALPSIVDVGNRDVPTRARSSCILAPLASSKSAFLQNFREIVRYNTATDKTAETARIPTFRPRSLSCRRSCTMKKYSVKIDNYDLRPENELAAPGLFFDLRNTSTATGSRSADKHSSSSELSSGPTRHLPATGAIPAHKWSSVVNFGLETATAELHCSRPADRVLSEHRWSAVVNFGQPGLGLLHGGRTPTRSPACQPRRVQRHLRQNVNREVGTY
mmetsp:Transcript_49661/g.153399  ORF Transcript_49661/g.153399 Transcript_49661/m.153399 type:complete len:242 (-) Transcript_49661:299-1024(-)